MSFNSTIFFIFFAVVVVLYYLIPTKHRWLLLLIGSYLFYMSWEPVYILLIFSSTIVDYFVSIKISETENRRGKNRLLFISLFFNLGLLFVFKYYNFFTANLEILASNIGLNYQASVSSLLLPVGISFYTFQTISYTIDVFRGELKPERHFGKFALYVSFFPQLVAGPIERATNLLPQINGIKKKVAFNGILAGILQFILGLFKKVVIADSAALYVDAIFNNHQYHDGSTFILASLFFTIQIYGDFSGYSDMAIGVARILGFKLMDNFHLPFFSKSTTELWRRWHISLGSWANDYMFKSFSPYWVRKFSKYGILISLIITFTLIGIWHGGRWTYILFGLMHGIILGVEFITKKQRKKLKKNIGLLFYTYAGWFITMFLWFISMILFRSITMDQFVYIIKEIFSSSIFNSLFIPELGVVATTLMGATILFFLEFFVFRKKSFAGLVKNYSAPLLALVTAMFIMVILIFGVSEGSQFIYFQF